MEKGKSHEAMCLFCVINSLWKKWICFHPSEMEVNSETTGGTEDLERSCKLKWYETAVKILD